MKVNTDTVNETLAQITSSIILRGFSVAHGETTVKDASLSIIRDATDGVSSALELGDSNKDEICMERIKHGIYSVIMAGIISGLDEVEGAETLNAKQALVAAKDAALSKSREVLPEMICDRLQSEVELLYAMKKEQLSEKNINSIANIAIESAEQFTNASVRGLKEVVQGETTVSEVVSQSISEVKKSVTDSVFSKAQSWVSESFDARSAVIESQVGKTSGSKNISCFTNETAKKVTSRGIGNMKQVVLGERTIAEAVESTVKDTATDISSEISSKMLDSVTSKINDTIGLNLFDSNTVIATGKKVKESFSRYVNGEINETQFFMEIGHDGLEQVAQKWGALVGTNLVMNLGIQGAAAAMTIAASSTLVTVVYGELYRYAMDVFQEEIESEERMKIIRQLSIEAIEVIREERESLLKNTFMQVEQRQKVFNESLLNLDMAISHGNVELLTEALNKIIEEVGGAIQFKSFEEFEEFMQDDSLELTF